MKLPLTLALAALGTVSALPAQAACYTVYQGARIIYRSTTPPVDLSRPYSETLPLRFGSGTSLVEAHDETGCSQVVLAAAGTPPEGISRGGSAARGKSTATPASLDGVFADPGLQMRSSVGVSGAASGPKVQHPVQR